MALAFDIMNGHGPSNKMCSQLKAKNSKVRLYYPLILLVLTMDKMHGRGQSNIMRPWLQPKTVLAIDIMAKGIIRAVHY